MRALSTEIPGTDRLLAKAAATVLEVKELFKRMRFGGWNLPSIRYDVVDDLQVMIEPQIDGSNISFFMKDLLSVLGLAIEDLVVYGFQREMKSPMAIEEIPLDKRGPQNAQRFRVAMRGSGDWKLKWTGSNFYESSAVRRNSHNRGRERRGKLGRLHGTIELFNPHPFRHLLGFCISNPGRAADFR